MFNILYIFAQAPELTLNIYTSLTSSLLNFKSIMVVENETSTVQILIDQTVGA